jgi:HEAT repeat protein
MDALRLAAADDSDPHQCIAALVLLGYFGELADVDLLARALIGADSNIGAAAALALERLLPRFTSSRAGRYDELPISGLRIAAGNGGAAARTAAVRIIRRHVDGPVVLEQMLESIEDPAPEVRMEAAHALADFGQDESVTALIVATHDPEDAVIAAAVWSLEQLGSPEAAPRLFQLLDRRTTLHPVLRALAALGDVSAAEAIGRLLLEGNDPEDRRAAAMALGKLRTVASVGPLIQALHDHAPTVRSAALVAVGELHAVGVLSRVVPLLGDGDDTVRRSAVLTLERLGTPDAIPSLNDVRRDDPNAGIRARAARALATLGYENAFTAITHLAPTRRQWRGLSRAVAELPWTPAIRTALRASLRSNDSHARIGAVWTFGERGDPQAARDLLPLLRVDDPALQRAVAWALGRLRAVEAAPELIDQCGHPEGSVREEIAWALGQCGDASGVAALIPMVFDPDNKVSLAAIRALGILRDARGAESLIAVACDCDADEARRCVATTALGPLRASGGLAVLYELLVNDNASIRRAAASALRVRRDAAAAAALSSASSDVDPTVREVAIVALADVAPDVAFEVVTQRISDPESSVRAAAAAALKQFPYDCSAAWLEQACDDRSPEVRVAAARTIGLFRDPRSLRALESLLEDGHRVVQRAVIVALGKVQPAEVHHGLVRAMGSPDPQLREAVALALREVDHPDAEAMLLSLAADDDPGVREVSQDARRHRASGDDSLP